MDETRRSDEEPPTVEMRVPVEDDLLRDGVLRGCATIEHEGRRRPYLGRIVLLARLGRGGMGVVYRGVNPRLGTEVAVKVVRADLDQPELADRFLREARLAARLRSDHLVAVADVDRDEATNAQFLVMEFVRGESAGAWIRRSSGAGGRMSEADALAVCAAATRGLAAAHAAGIVHRDVKPDNILVPHGPSGEPRFDEAKLADLGLAHAAAADESLTGTAAALGTPGYMAPEQTQDAKRAGPAADVFSMGATLHALLCGSVPFGGDTPVERMMNTLQRRPAPVRDVRPDVSPATARVVERCLAKSPADRFADAADLLAELERCRGPRPAGPPRQELPTSPAAEPTLPATPPTRVVAAPTPPAAAPVAAAPPPAVRPTTASAGGASLGVRMALYAAGLVSVVLLILWFQRSIERLFESSRFGDGGWSEKK